MVISLGQELIGTYMETLEIKRILLCSGDKLNELVNHLENNLIAEEEKKEKAKANDRSLML